jgi:hypothetical protein
LRRRGGGVAARTRRRGDDRLGDGAFVYHNRVGIADDRARAGGHPIVTRGVEQARFGLAARRGAAEQRLERLGAGVAALGGRLTGLGGHERVIGRDDERRVAGDRELVRTVAAGNAARAAAGQQEQAGRSGEADVHDTHSHLSSWGAFRSRVSSARTSNSRTPMVMAASPTLKTKKG